MFGGVVVLGEGAAATVVVVAAVVVHHSQNPEQYSIFILPYHMLEGTKFTTGKI
jgi:hypothetical protein